MLVCCSLRRLSSLASKPANVHLFARDYFSNFLPESTADAELDALAADEAEEESLMKGDQEDQ